MADPLDVIVHQARLLLEQLAKPNGQPAEKLLKLKPRDDDYDAVFLPSAVIAARAGYTGLWPSPPGWPVKPDQTSLRIGAAYVEDFATDDPRTKPFPGGYKGISGHLVPGRVWLVWEYLTPGAMDGILFDGLVALPDHFAWFPKPWRVVPPAA